MINLTPLLDDDEAEATLTVTPLTPVAMNASVPSKHMRTASVPPIRQIRGTLENALGLHFGVTELRQNVGEVLGISISRMKKQRFQSVLSGIEIEPPDEHDDADAFTFDDDQWLHKWRNSTRNMASVNVKDYRSDGSEPNRHAYGKTVIRREYLVTGVSWTFSLRAPEAFLQMLRRTLEDPKAPLYIGTSDGWVDASLSKPTPV